MLALDRVLFICAAIHQDDELYTKSIEENNGYTIIYNICWRTIFLTLRNKHIFFNLSAEPQQWSRAPCPSPVGSMHKLIDEGGI